MFANTRHFLAFREPPFRIQEKGWGEFDMQLILTAINKGGDHTIEHDLNFLNERYEAKHTVVWATKHYNTPQHFLTVSSNFHIDLPQPEVRTDGALEGVGTGWR